MKLKIPFYYHILLFLAVSITFYVWDIGVNNRKLEFVFNPIYFIFNTSFIFSIFIVYLLNFYTFCDWFLNKKRALLYLLTVPVSLFIFAGVRYFLQEVVVFEMIGIHNYAEETRKMESTTPPILQSPRRHRALPNRISTSGHPTRKASHCNKR